MGGRPSFDRTCYNCGEPRHMRRNYPHARVMDSAHQYSRAVVPTGNGNTCWGHVHGGRGGNQRSRVGWGYGNGGRCTVKPNKEVALHGSVLCLPRKTKVEVSDAVITVLFLFMTWCECVILFGFYLLLCARVVCLTIFYDLWYTWCPDPWFYPSC